MQQELLHSAIQVFDTELPDKWNAFIDLSEAKEDITKQWYSKLRNEMQKYFDSNPIGDWRYRIGGNLIESHWYLDTLGDENTMQFYFPWINFAFSINAGIYDTNKVNMCLQSPDYAEIKLVFSQISRFLHHSHEKISEDMYWQFGCPFDNRFNPDRLAWYAGHQTDKLLDQIIGKVDRFRKNERVAEQILKLAEKTSLQKNTIG